MVLERTLKIPESDIDTRNRRHKDSTTTIKTETPGRLPDVLNVTDFCVSSCNCDKFGQLMPRGGDAGKNKVILYVQMKAQDDIRTSGGLDR